MKLEKVDYSKLNARQKEVFNFQKIVGHLADYGFNCIKLADDWQGADFLAYHKDGTNTLKVQLKARLTINRQYEGKELHMAFPIKESWYLIEHDQLVIKVQENTNWLNTKSWIEEGHYNSSAPSAQLVTSLQAWKL